MHRLVLVGEAGEAPPPEAGQVVAVLDTAWYPGEGGAPARADCISIRPAVGRVLDRADTFNDARLALDRWAAAVDLDGASTIDGVAWWHRFRLSLWLRLVETMHWVRILDALRDLEGAPAAISAPAALPRLADAVRLVGARDGIATQITGPAGTSAADSDDRPSDDGPATGAAATGAAGRGSGARPDPSPRAASWLADLVHRGLGWPARRLAAWEQARRRAVLDARIAGFLAEEPGRLLVFTVPAVAQAAELSDGDRRVDPFLDSVVTALRETRLDPILVALGTHRHDDAAWLSIEPAARTLPESQLSERWGSPADEAPIEAAVAGVRAGIAALPAVALEGGGVDFAPLMLAELDRFAASALPGRLRMARRARRMLEELRAAGILLYNEYGRLEWVAAARDAGVPAFAVQHGIIYPGHLGYVHPRSPGLLLPRRTFLFGSYEAGVLRQHGGYAADEVLVTGAPRLALVGGGGEVPPLGPAAREEIRRRLGVRPGDRMVVISTTHEPVHRRFYWPHSLGRLLAGELPRVHLVFKQHPAEKGDGDYRRLVEGIARSAGVAAPPVSVVREIDLYALLRAADAHLGLYSTVLTDAVAAGTPNLVATTQVRQDLLGYVEAGVAVPVATPAELRAAIDAASPPPAAARAAFIGRHFEPGDAPGAIRRALLEATATPPVGPGVPT